jgi:NhaP-type Na+/H+ or K+/H+ antiporter
VGEYELFTLAIAIASAVAPTDAVAATSVLNRLGAPQRIVTIMEGESLINDGVALTAFGLAVEAMAQPFTFAHGVARLVEVVVGGIGYGLVVALVIGRVRRFVRDPSIQILVSLITPFVAYVPAEELHVSGVLATVVTGVYLGTRAEGMLQVASRASGRILWQTLVFLLESALFIALTLPLTARGRPFTERPTLVFLAAVVVVATLIGEGLTLAPLIRALGLGESEQQRRREAMARARVTEAGLARLDELAQAGEVDEDTANVYRQLFEMRLERVRAALGDTDSDGPADTSGFRAELVRAQRDKLAELYRVGKISDEIRRSISRTLDLQERRRDG